MSWLSNVIKDPLHHNPIKATQDFSKKVWKGAEHLIAKIPHTTQAEKRAAMYAANEQMDFYHKQKQSMADEQSRLADQRHNEQQRIHEKQIRALRRNFRSPGFLEGPVTGTTEKLG